LGVDAYREMGYLPEALRNYLLRLGWGHGDEEIISTAQAIEWFDIDAVGKAPARFDFTKLANLNGHYIRAADDDRLVAEIIPRLERTLGHSVDAVGRDRLRRAMPGLRPRAKTLVELAESAAFLVRPRPLALDAAAQKLLTPEARGLLRDLADELAAVEDWSAAALESCVRATAEARAAKLGSLAQPLRAALSGSNVSPPIFAVMEVLGREETLARVRDAVD
jgi:glutamyl-tRNA synthetase